MFHLNSNLNISKQILMIPPDVDQMNLIEYTFTKLVMRYENITLVYFKKYNFIPKEIYNMTRIKFIDIFMYGSNVISNKIINMRNVKLICTNALPNSVVPIIFHLTKLEKVIYCNKFTSASLGNHIELKTKDVNFKGMMYMYSHNYDTMARLNNIK